MAMTLREKLLLPVMATVALGMGAGFLYSYLASTNAIENGVRKALAREVRTTAGLVDKWLDARHTDLLTWSRTPVLAAALVEKGYYGERAREGANDLLATLEQGYPYYDFLFVADAQGYLISTSHRSEPRKYRINDRPYFQETLNGSLWISDMITSRESGEKVFVVAVPLKQGAKIVGILAGAINVADFGSFFIHDFKLDQKGFAYMVDEFGEIMAISDPRVALGRIDNHEFGRQILDTGKGSLVFRHQDQQFLASYGRLDNKGWIFVVNQSLDEAFISARKIGWYTLVAGLVLLIIVAVVVTDIFRKMIYQRFDRMLEAIGMVEQGQLDVRILGGDERDEIGEMTKAFNTMTARLESTLENLTHEIQVRKETEKALANHRDTLEMRVAERTSELLALRNYLSDMINSMPSVIVGVTRDMMISQWNLKAEQVTGITQGQAVGTAFKDRFPHLKELVPAMEKAIGDKEIFYQGKVGRAEPHDSRYEDITVYPLKAKGMEGAVIRIDDVTERVNLDKMMVQSEKMMSVGGLAAGMAHEINNPLAGMVQNIQVMKNRMRPELPKNAEIARELGIPMEVLQGYMEKRGMFKLIENAVSAGSRAAAIVENMLSFSRKDSQTSSRVVLADLMERTIELALNDYTLQGKFDFRNIYIHREYMDEELAVFGHSSMLQQVFFNILKNGAQAMASTVSGTKPRFDISIHANRENAVIGISDNGPGMDKETARRIFEPFFSTKGVGKGTGLGLSVSYFIISENHGGTIEVNSEPGKGAAFTIELPLSPKKSPLVEP